MIKLGCAPLSNGNVRITGNGEVTAYEASRLIVEMAKAAREAHRLYGERLPDRTGTAAAIPYIEASAIGLVSGPRADYVTLSLQFGEVEIGIAIGKLAAAHLGYALIAACENSSVANYG